MSDGYLWMRECALREQSVASSLARLILSTAAYVRRARQRRDARRPPVRHAPVQP